MSNMNISSLSVEQLVKELLAVYIPTVRNNMQHKVPAVFLWGPPGVGKSGCLWQISEGITQATGKTVYIIDLRLSEYTMADLLGIPVPDQEKVHTKWLVPEIFDLDRSDEVVNLLMLDELSSISGELQKAAYKLVLDRKVGEYKLPDNTIVIAAGNRTTDGAIAFRMSSALANRFIHFEVKADFDSWQKWAVSHDVSPYVIGFLTQYRSSLFRSEKTDDIAFPTPRSWMFVSDLLNMRGSSVEDLYDWISGAIGHVVATEFVAYCRHHKDFIPVEEIFQGTASKYPKRADQIYALISAINSYAGSRKGLLSVKEIDNMCRYVSRFPNDYAAALYMSLSRIPEVKTKLFRSDTFKKWFALNKNVFGGNANG